jgi:hypothetical protein
MSQRAIDDTQLQVRSATQDATKSVDTGTGKSGGDSTISPSRVRSSPTTDTKDLEAFGGGEPKTDVTVDLRQTRQIRAYFTLLFKWWHDEWVSTFLCLLVTAMLVLLLVKYDGQPVPDLLGDWQLDTFVIAMTSVIRVSMGFIVESSMSQAAWIWVSKARQGRCKHKAKLQDFKLFGDASRGL